jgi:hypothetical protein
MDRNHGTEGPSMTHVTFHCLPNSTGMTTSLSLNKKVSTRGRRVA